MSINENTRRRRSRSFLEADDEADATRYSDAASPATSTNGAGAKRQRRGPNARSSRAPSRSPTDQDEDGEEASSEEDFHSYQETNTANTPPSGQPNGTSSYTLTNGHASRQSRPAQDGFLPGAIVRVRLENFVTYESAEFFPGPNLNMVIGPNGTGKSSLVCAICLGLGYHTNVLGRATSFGEFVKHGRETAAVEVELKCREQDKRNVTVRLRIKRADNSRKFWLNGQEATLKGVQLVMKELRIAIDNLCQFLPQDKVAEFAGLDPVDLLTKTLGAVAPPKMIKQQQELRNMFVRQKESKQSLENDIETLRSHETRQQHISADVQRLRERAEVQAKITDLSDAKVLKLYNEARAAYAKAKEDKKTAELRRRRLERESEPSLLAVNRKIEYRDKVQGAVDARKRTLRSAEQAADEKIKEIERVKDDMTGLEGKQNAEKEAMKTKRQNLQAIKKKITTLQGKLGAEPKEFNPAEWNMQIRAQEHLIRENQREITEIQTEQQARLRAQGKDKANEMKRLQANIDHLESQEGQQLSQLRRINEDVAKGWEWLQANQDEFGFEHEVFGPPMLSCLVKDERYSDLIQSMLQQDDFLCFTTQSKNDHKKLSDQFFGKMSLGVTVRTIFKPLSEYARPLPEGELRTLGLDGFALDYIQGPDPVLAMLCAEKRLQQSGVALRPVSDEQYQRIADGDAINSWAAGGSSYRINRRKEFGRGAVSTTTKNVQPGRFWKDAPADDTEKRGLQAKYDEVFAEFRELKEQNEEVKKRLAALDGQQDEIKKKKEELSRTKNELQMAYNQWKAIPDKIDQENQNLARQERSLFENKTIIRDLDTQLDNLAIQFAKLVLSHKSATDAIGTAYSSWLEAQVRFLEAKSDVDSLTERNQDIVNAIEAERKKVEEFHREAQRLRGKAEEAQAEAHNISQAEGWADRKDQLLEIMEGADSAESLAEDIVAEEAKLQLIHAADPGVLKDFEQRAVQIERLTRQKQGKEDALTRLDAEITALREKWEPRLDAMIGRINDAFAYNFAQISCAGEVGVHKDEDFGKWAVEIKVKFRENETLQKLDQHRQSGGERAVSTIFYLMSLQSMAQAPFRVVDEINQGMDPRNERMVHERMVEIACGDDEDDESDQDEDHDGANGVNGTGRRGKKTSSQYFLITPKLLPGLKYHHKMKVLCIASGAYMPPAAPGNDRSGGKRGGRASSVAMDGDGGEDGGRGVLDLARCVEIKRRLVAASA